MSDPTDAPTPAERIVKLAREAASFRHEQRAWMRGGKAFTEGHKGPFVNCKHPDCVLVSADAAASRAPKSFVLNDDVSVDGDPTKFLRAGSVVALAASRAPSDDNVAGTCSVGTAEARSPADAQPKWSIHAPYVIGGWKRDAADLAGLTSGIQDAIEASPIAEATVTRYMTTQAADIWANGPAVPETQERPVLHKLADGLREKAEAEDAARSLQERDEAHEVSERLRDVASVGRSERKDTRADSVSYLRTVGDLDQAEVVSRAAQYFAHGGLFNPEMMSGQATAQLIGDLLGVISQLQPAAVPVQDAPLITPHVFEASDRLQGNEVEGDIVPIDTSEWCRLCGWHRHQAIHISTPVQDALTTPANWNAPDASNRTPVQRLLGLSRRLDEWDNANGVTESQSQELLCDIKLCLDQILPFLVEAALRRAAGEKK